MLILDLILGIGLAGGVLAIIYAIGWWILGPIDRAAKARKQPGRIAIIDFLCLFVAVQLPLALVSRLQSEETKSVFWICTILAWFVAPAIWACCAVALSRAGVTNGRHRLVFMGIVLPVVYYGLVPFVLLATLGMWRVAAGQSESLLKFPHFMAMWIGVGIALIGCGLFTNRMVAAKGEPVSASPSTE